MAQGQAVLGQECLGRRTAQPGLEGRRHRVGVDVEQLVEADQVERDDAREALAASDEAADHRGAAAERDQRDVALDRPVDQRRDLVVAAGAHDRVRRVRAVTGAELEQVGGGLAARAVQPGLVVGEHVLGPDDPGELVEQLVCPATAESRTLVGPTAGVSVVPMKASTSAKRALGQRAGLGRVAPAGPVHL